MAGAGSSSPDFLKLLSKIANGDKSKAEQLVSDYKDFILEEAKRCKAKYQRKYEVWCELSLDDLFAEGVVGLLQAVKDVGYWNKFSDCVRKMIKEKILAAIIREIDFKAFNSRLKEEFAAYRKVRARLFRKLRRSPTIAELVKATKFSSDKVEQLEKLHQIAMDYEYE